MDKRLIDRYPWGMTLEEEDKVGLLCGRHAFTPYSEYHGYPDLENTDMSDSQLKDYYYQHSQGDLLEDTKTGEILEVVYYDWAGYPPDDDAYIRGIVLRTTMGVEFELKGSVYQWPRLQRIE